MEQVGRLRMRMNESELHISSLLGEKYYKSPHRSGLAIYVCPKDVSTTVATLAVQYGGADLRFRLAGEENLFRDCNCCCRSSREGQDQSR